MHRCRELLQRDQAIRCQQEKDLFLGDLLTVRHEDIPFHESREHCVLAKIKCSICSALFRRPKARIVSSVSFRFLRIPSTFSSKEAFSCLADLFQHQAPRG